MQNLKYLQIEVYHSLLQGNVQDLSFINSSYPVERLNVYRQNIMENMRNALSITFPGVWKLLGEDCADSVAYAFCKVKSNLPVSGYLDEWGLKFPYFLSQQEELSSLLYLRDYATYEWLKHKAYGAEHVVTIAAAKESDRIRFIPSLFTFTSQYAIRDIQELVDNPDAKPINSTTNKVYGVVARPAGKVTTFWIAKDLWHFIDYLEHEVKLIEAWELTQEQYPYFDGAGAIHFLFRNNLVMALI